MGIDLYICISILLNLFSYFNVCLRRKLSLTMYECLIHIMC